MTATAMADVQIDLGCFANTNPVPNCSYEGDYQNYVTSWEVDGYTSSNGYTMIDLDLGGIMSTLSGERIVSVSIVDFGSNNYGQSSPGADIDYVGFHGLDDGIDVSVGYSGPTTEHLGESEQDILQRLDSLDAFYGANHIDDDVYVSLGNMGALTFAFSGASEGGGGSNGDVGGGDDGGDGGIGSNNGLAGFGDFHMQFSEVGSFEHFSVYIETTSIPAPAGLLALCGLGLQRRRRN
jgi:MYXO-CTERM domain-containing protein